MRRAALLLAGLLIGAAPSPPARVFIAGDSTAQDYAPSRYPQSGWGTMLRCAFGDDVTVENRAIGGRSTKSFIAEGRLDAVARDLRAGDTLLIQFGHNDADTRKPERFTPIPDYRANLIRMIRVARDAGAQPVLLTPVARRAFAGRKVAPSFPDYAAAMRTVARDTRTPLIELGRLSARWVERAGPGPSAQLYLHRSAADGAPGFPNGIDDDTHFSELGARGVADIVAGRLAGLRLPISRRVHRHRPALTRTLAAGGPSCA